MYVCMYMYYENFNVCTIYVCMYGGAPCGDLAYIVHIRTHLAAINKQKFPIHLPLCMIGGEWECRYMSALQVPSNTRFIAQTGQLLE